MSLARKLASLLTNANQQLDPNMGGVPTGTVFDYALSTAPTGYVMCYGQALLASDTAAANLRAALIAAGNPYGVSGSDPLVPDCRGRVIAGKDNMGGSAASRLTSGGGGVDGATLGANGGAETHTLTAAQIPAHTHPASDTGGATGSASGGGKAFVGTNSAASTGPNTGGGNAHNNTQPTLILNKIIKL